MIWMPALFFCLLLSLFPLLGIAHFEKRISRSLKLILVLWVFLCNAAFLIWLLQGVRNHYDRAFYRTNLKNFSEQLESAPDQVPLLHLEKIKLHPQKVSPLNHDPKSATDGRK